MPDSINPIDRLARFVQGAAKVDDEQAEKQQDNLLLSTCRQLAPLFDQTSEEIAEVWAECTAHEEERAKAFRMEIDARGMSCVHAFVPPNNGKVGRPKRDSLDKLIMNIRKTMLWKQFLQIAREGDGLVLLAFKLSSKKKTWILTNRQGAADPANFAGRIVIPVKGAPDVQIMPLETYLKENL